MNDPTWLNGKWVSQILRAVLTRPALWTTSMRQVFTLARPGWWKRWPPLPLPDPNYLRFRLVTAYGDAERPPNIDDVIAYLHWCKRARTSR